MSDLKLNLACGPYLLKGFINMDPKVLSEETTKGYDFRSGYDFRKPLEFEDNSVDAITISHSLFWLWEFEYLSFFNECYRVLKPGGIIRIADENNDVSDEMKKQYQIPYKPDVNSHTGLNMVTKYLQDAGFNVVPVTSTTTKYKDDSLMQVNHPHKLPAIFFVEGIK